MLRSLLASTLRLLWLAVRAWIAFGIVLLGSLYRALRRNALLKVCPLVCFFSCARFRRVLIFFRARSAANPSL